MSCCNNKKQRYILFDFDGTLADSMNLILDVINQVIIKGGDSISKEDIVFFKEKGMLEFLKRKKAGPIKTALLLHKGRKEFKKRIDEINLFSGIVESISKLSENECRLGIVTSNRKEIVESILKKEGILDKFDFIHSEPSLFKKDIALRHVICKFNIDTEKSFYVGDELRDAKGAKANKLSFVGVSWGLNNKDALISAGAVRVIDIPEDILSLLP